MNSLKIRSCFILPALASTLLLAAPRGAQAQCRPDAGLSTEPITLGLSIKSALKDPSPRELDNVKAAIAGIKHESDPAFIKRIIYVLAALDEKERAWEGPQLGFAYFLAEGLSELMPAPKKPEAPDSPETARLKESGELRAQATSQARQQMLGRFFARLNCVTVSPGFDERGDRVVRVRLDTVRGETIKLRQEWLETKVSLDIAHGMTIEIAEPSREEIVELTQPKGRFYFSKNISQATRDTRRNPEKDDVIGTSSEVAKRFTRDVATWLDTTQPAGTLPSRILRLTGLSGDLSGPDLSVPGKIRIDRLLLLPGVNLPEALLGPTDVAGVASATVKWKFVKLARARAAL